ncbi:TonB-dependent siderophore receptor [Nodosilinea sp. LEGE 07088]|uniref:TonB-dependent siderophore receptor n=1 Tax=Nodosilinea sp. LEGE 07088 TaxID=2777968 RepID=UPI0018802C63|nr:TonB-dependent siderophore receptor [Nodosilinea sp. LEGE 07088]MBE9136168.1 TonB-dependent siderophore receptor [Nodosilinea sp. LEGE 07088]
MMTSKLGFGLFVMGLLAGVTAPVAGAESPLQESEPVPAALTVEEWMAQGQADAAAVITDVQITDAPEGLRIELVSDHPLNTDPSRIEGNALITDIPNAVLELANQAAAEQFAPAEGIALVQVTSLPDGTVRVAITGTDGPPTAQVDTAAGNLVLSVVPGLAQLDGAEDAIQIGVTGQGQQAYRVPNAAVGSRTDTPLRDLPFSVQVVPQELLQDRQVQSVNEALRTVVGISPDNSSQSAFEGYTIRGFSGRNILRNGLRDDTNITSRIAIPNVERIEVLRGPAGALFSQGAPGGTVNIVTKKPLATPHYIVEGTIGNFDTYGGSIDFTGPLNQSETLLYRLTAGASSAGTFIDFFERRNYVIAPTISWQVGPNTQINFEGEYTISEQPNDRGLPAVGTVLPNINGQLPRNRFIGEPDDELDKNNRYVLRLGYTLDHQINPDWQLQNSFRASFQQTPQNSLFPTDLLADQRTLERGIFSTSDQSQDNYSFDTSLTGTVQTGSISHQLLLGFDVNRDIYASSSQQFSLDPIDIFNPVYGVAQRQFVADYPREPFITNSVGVYVQDQIDLLPQLKLLLGGRFDLVSQQSLFADGTEAFQDDTAFSPRLGLVYQPSDEHALYASYSRSFLQSVGTAFDNTLFEPERGNQYEVGIKSDWLDNRLSTTLALYQITRTNVLTEDPINPNFSVQTGEQRSRGLELTATGEILPGWNIVAGYAYTDAQITADNTLAVGNRLNNVPEHAASLWTTYEIQEGSLQGLGFGLGLFYVGDRQGDLDNSFQVPGYTRTDASVFYTRENFRVGLNLENLFDITYFEAAESPLRVFYGAPFTVRGTVSWSF